MVDSLCNRGPEGAAFSNLAITAFWGMTRLAKLTYPSRSGQVPARTKPTVNDVVLYSNVASWPLHRVMTDTAGDTQELNLQPLRSDLCPVQVLRQRITTTSSLPDSLFSLHLATGRTHLKNNAWTTSSWR
ncbi:hypothetical protein PCASD_21685 [Puccinia coronata f. sp. avenae]|uniref:Uncharacterized protein n=1 Tax=Puccinia coronata f. sp. avenae TaxID=200324 RepID=A0A2N5U378_9BASI|nr:hypothetical protein PCASD_21685 [Puccinia coronata f. sp. avenae]